MTDKKKRVLLTFSGLPLAADILKLTCLFVKECAAELQLLRIHLPQDVVTERVHGEQLYSEMKTLHAQFEQRGIPAALAADPGHNEKPIVDYLSRHEVDLLIFIAQKRENGSLEDEDDQVLQTIFRSRRCPAMLIA